MADHGEAGGVARHVFNLFGQHIEPVVNPRLEAGDRGGVWRAANSSSAAEPPSKPRHIGVFLPTLSEIIPARSCDRPLTKE